MSEEQNQVPPVVVPPAPTPEGEQPWLKARLEQAERSTERKLLESLGVTDLASASKAIQAAKAAEEAGKSAEQRAAELAASLQSTQQTAQQQAAVLQQHAAQMMAVLSPEQQAAIKDVAGEDPTAQLKAINAFGKTWGTQAPPQTLNTAPPRNMPAPGDQSPADHHATFKTLQSQNPFAAAAYARQHGDEVFKQKA